MTKDLLKGGMYKVPERKNDKKNLAITAGGINSAGSINNSQDPPSGRLDWPHHPSYTTN